MFWEVMWLEFLLWCNCCSVGEGGGKSCCINKLQCAVGYSSGILMGYFVLNVGKCSAVKQFCSY